MSTRHTSTCFIFVMRESSIRIVHNPNAGCGTATLRAGKIKPDLFVAVVLLQVSAVLAVFVGHSLPSAIALGVAFAVSRLARSMTVQAVFVIGILPTLALVLALVLTPQVLSYSMRSGPTDSWSGIVGPLVTVAVAIGGSMLWVRWREERDARRNRRP